ncbi:hypothetical protein JL720_8646 [Aureococcus anophagefferens]|nr:hypothetical protein JL720_8646 [Aureococcus anophagefferens]
MPPSLLLLLATAAALTAPTSRRWTWAHSGGGPVDIHYTACGPADARSCVVFAPGFGAGSFQFEEVASLVADRGHAVYCMDWFGQGKSAPRPAVVRSLLSEVYATKDACDEALAAQICDAASHPVGPDAFASILFSGRSRLEFADALEALAGQRDLRLALIYGKEDPWIQPVWGQRAARRLARAGAAFDYVDAALGHLLGAWTGEASPPPLPAEPVVERDGRRVSVAACDGEPRGLVERVAALASNI